MSLPPTIVKLDYLDWSVCAGGRHYTGSVVISEPFRRIELERSLSLREAKELSETQERLWMCHERTTNKFDTLAQLENAAAKWCEKNLGPDWLLQEHGNYGPLRPIAAGGRYKAILPKLRALAKRWDKVRDHQTDQEMMQSYAEWEKLITL